MTMEYKKILGKGKKILLRSCQVILVISAASLLALGIFLLTLGYRGKTQFREDTIGSIAGMRMDRHNTSELGLDVGTSSNDGAPGTPGEAGDNGIQEIGLEEGQVLYNGKVYAFNEDILTFLIMGIDQHSETVQEQTEGYGGGSADAIFLLVLDPHKKKIRIIALDRNTMTDVDIYDYYGNYVETVQAQINVQHGFGDGTVKSAAYMEKAVSNVFHGLPINGYCAVNMSAIPKINDAVDGVDVLVLDDITAVDKTLVKGEQVHLMGMSAFWYVKYRDTNEFGSAAGRLERQEQYLTAYVSRAKEKLRKNPTLAVALFTTLKNYMTTDITAGKVTYLASNMADYEFGSMDICKVAGETIQGERFEEFYVDEEALYELILDVFYEETEQNK